LLKVTTAEPPCLGASASAGTAAINATAVTADNNSRFMVLLSLSLFETADECRLSGRPHRVTPARGLL
jgi:hypothetical protein